MRRTSRLLMSRCTASPGPPSGQLRGLPERRKRRRLRRLPPREPAPVAAVAGKAAEAAEALASSTSVCCRCVIAS